MNSNIINALRAPNIPDPEEGLRKSLTLQHLMGRNELQQQQIQAAGQPKAMGQKEQAEWMGKLARAVSNAPPNARASVYAQVLVPYWSKLGLPSPRPIPPTWSEEYLPHLEAMARWR